MITDPQVAKVQLDAIKWTAARLHQDLRRKAEIYVGGSANGELAQVIRWER